MNKLYTFLLLILITPSVFAQSGTLDSSFGNNGFATTMVSPTYNFAYATIVQPDGKIIVVGDSGEPATYKTTVVRFNPDGTLDTSFGTGAMLQSLFQRPNHSERMWHSRSMAK